MTGEIDQLWQRAESMLQQRQLRDILQRRDCQPHVLVLVGTRIELPPDLEALAVRFTPRLPDAHALLKLVREEAENYARENGGRRVEADSEAVQQIVRNLRGLDPIDARRIARHLIFEDGALGPDDLPQLALAAGVAQVGMEIEQQVDAALVGLLDRLQGGAGVGRADGVVFAVHVEPAQAFGDAPAVQRPPHLAQGLPEQVDHTGFVLGLDDDQRGVGADQRGQVLQLVHGASGPWGRAR